MTLRIRRGGARAAAGLVAWFLMVLALVLVGDSVDGILPVPRPLALVSIPPDVASDGVSMTPQAPERIAIPTIDVYAKVVPVGVDATGGVAVPEDIGTIGWYRDGALLGSRHGSTLLVGHRDARDYGAGAFFELDTMSEGDRIFVSGAGGAMSYVVAQVQILDKGEFDRVSAEIFATTGDPRLTLVTCGGEFDFDKGSYISNVIVTAYPE